MDVTQLLADSGVIVSRDERSGRIEEGNRLLGSGRYPEALAAFAPCDDLFDDHERTTLEYAEFCHSFGNALTLTGELALADERLKRAVALFADLGKRLDQMGAILDLGRVYQLNDPLRASDCYRRARRIGRGLPDNLRRRLEGHALITLSSLYVSIGAYQQACATLDDYDALPPGPTDPDQRWNVLFLRAVLAQAAGDLTKSLALHIQAAEVAAKLRNPERRAETETAIARLRRQLQTESVVAPKPDTAKPPLRRLLETRGVNVTQLVAAMARRDDRDHRIADGDGLSDSGRATDAVEMLRPCENLFDDQERNTLEYAVFCHTFGDALAQTGETALAEERLERAVDLFADHGETWEQVRSMLNLGDLYRYRNNRLRASDCYRRARDLARGFADPARRNVEGRALLGLSRLYIGIEAYEQACAALDEFEALAPGPIDDPEGRWSLLSQRGALAEIAGDFAEALSLYVQAADVAAEWKNPKRQQESERAIARLRRLLQKDESLRPNPDKVTHAGTGSMIGRDERDRRIAEGGSLLNSGRATDAVETLRPCDPLFDDQERNTLQYAEFCNAFGAALAETGEMALAEERLKHAVALFADHRQIAGQIEAMLNLGNVYRYMNSRQRAADCYHQALELARGLAAPMRRSAEGHVLIALSFFYLRNRLLEQAGAVLDEFEALPPDPTMGVQRWCALTQRASLADNAGDPAEALSLHMKAADVAAELDDRGYRAESEQAIALLRSRLHGDEPPLPDPDSVTSTGGTWREIEKLARMANHALEEGRSQQAFAYFEECLSSIDRIRASVVDEAMRYHFTEWAAVIAQAYCAGLVAHGHAAQALGAAEQAQGRALLDTMFAHQRRRQGGRSIRCAVGGSLLLDVPAGEEIAQTLHDENLHLLRLLHTRDRLLVWYAGPDGEVFGWDATEALSTLEELHGKLMRVDRHDIDTPDDGAPRPLWSAVQAQLESTYEALFVHEDARKRLQERTGRLLIMPHLMWFHIPWHALGPCDGDPIGARWEISLAPSFGVYLQLDPSRDPTPRSPDTFVSRVDAFGEIASQIVTVPTLPIPDSRMTTLRFEALPRSGDEARSVARILDGQAIAETAATGQRILQALKSARIVHLATHGYWHPVEGGLSFLLVAPDPAGSAPLARWPRPVTRSATAPPSTADPRLFGHALQETESNAELVVLSACQSGIGAPHVDSYINLPHSLLVGGVRAVISALWPVDDTFTMTFFDRFYEQIGTGASPAAALQSTQEEFRDMVDGWDWAAFSLTGWGFAPTGTRQPAPGSMYAGNTFRFLGVEPGQKIPEIPDHDFRSGDRMTLDTTTNTVHLSMREDVVGAAHLEGRPIPGVMDHLGYVTLTTPAGNAIKSGEEGMREDQDG